MAICFVCVFVGTLTVSQKQHDLNDAVAQIRQQLEKMNSQMREIVSTLNSVLDTQDGFMKEKIWETDTTIPSIQATYAQDALHILPPLQVSLEVTKGAVFEKEALFSSDVYFYVPGEGYLTLQDVIRVIKEINSRGDCSDIACVHGIVSSDCTCTCFDHWTGTDCSERLCSDGTWDALNEACVCEEGFDPLYDCTVPLCSNGGLQTQDGCVCPAGTAGVFCEIIEPSCEDACQGTCIGGSCVCDDFQVGDQCEYNCSASGIRDGHCFFELSNTGYDTCATFQKATVCYCGGGFEKNLENELLVKVGMCFNCEADTLDLASCCKPGKDCSRQRMCSTEACCSSQMTASDCSAAGCAWCLEDSQCVLSRDVQCPFNAVLLAPRTIWSSEVLQCQSDGQYQDECSYDIKQTYLEIYEYFEQNDTTGSVTAREYVNSLPWQRRNVLDASQIGRTFLLGVSTENSSISLCPGLSYVGIVKQFEYSGAVQMGIVCDERDATIFSYKARPPCDAYSGEGLLLGFYINSIHHCLSDRMVQQNKLDSYTDSSSNVHLDAVIGVSLNTYFTSMLSMQNVCANTRFDVNNGTFISISSTSSYLSVHPSSQLIWSTQPSGVQFSLQKKYTY